MLNRKASSQPVGVRTERVGVSHMFSPAQGRPPFATPFRGRMRATPGTNSTSRLIVASGHPIA